MAELEPREILAAFGRAVRTHRQRLQPRVSQEKLAELAGVHRTFTSAIERGLQNVSLISLVRVAGALGVRPSLLLRTTEEELAKTRKTPATSPRPVRRKA